MKYSELGPTQKKIIISLLSGLALSLSRTPKTYFRVFRLMRSEWKSIPQQSFNRSFSSLSDRKLIEEKLLANGSFRLVLTEEGRQIAKLLDIKKASIELRKSKNWDGKWRIVIFDIPEKNRVFRDILREHLYTLEFMKLQHSVFISPQPYEDSILELIKIYSAQQYVRVITATKIDNEKNLKKIFSINK